MINFQSYESKYDFKLMILNLQSNNKVNIYYHLQSLETNFYNTLDNK